MKPKNTAPRLNTKNSVFGEGKELHATSPLFRVGRGDGGGGGRREGSSHCRGWEVGGEGVESTQQCMWSNVHD